MYNYTSCWLLVKESSFRTFHLHTGSGNLLQKVVEWEITTVNQEHLPFRRALSFWQKDKLVGDNSTASLCSSDELQLEYIIILFITHLLTIEGMQISSTFRLLHVKAHFSSTFEHWNFTPQFHKSQFSPTNDRVLGVS